MKAKKSLAQLLAAYNLTEKHLKALTGLPIYRLRAIYERGDFTDEEFKQLLQGLTVRQAVSVAYASIVGNYNQQGNGNKQHIEQNVLNNITIIVMRRLGMLPSAVRPTTLPRPNQPQHVATGAVQLRASGQLPGGQVALIKSGLAPRREFQQQP